jgi:tripartite-type tricarboxylate transporter receptor subunit TctC
MVNLGRQIVWRFVSGLVLALAAVSVHAQPYPSKPIRIVNAFAPGGPADLLARLVAQKLQEAWGQPVIVESKTGAAGNIGMEFVAKAPPDGYTLGVGPTGNLVVNQHIFAKLPYDPFKDFAPITLLATVENVLVVNADVPAKTVQELVALARAKPGTLNFASPGSGSQAHLAGELLKSMTGIDIVHVAYKGTGPALNDLMGGQVTMMFSQMSSALPHVKSGKLRALGVASPRRSAAAPEVRTVAEQGLAGFEAVSWYALIAPSGTPAEIIDKLQQEVARLLQLPDVKEKLAGLGAEPVGNTPAELAARMRAESARWAQVVKAAGIKAD